jgi:tetratricopeptide (TPR) repeat protein
MDTGNGVEPGANDGVTAPAGGSGGASNGAGTTPGTGPVTPTQFTDPRVQALQQAIDQGDLVQAGALRTQVDAVLTPVDRSLYDARLALLLEDDIAMEQNLAAARGLAPGDARVLATAIEVHAWRGMEDTASQEMARALENFEGGLLPPEILRAQGIVDICTERMSRVGLKHLEDARAARPDLPFCDRALSQAHMLVGKSHAGTDRRTALTHALTAAEFDPGDPDVRVFLADMLMMNGEWGAGLQVFEEAIASGDNLGPELANHYQKAGIVALGQGQRDIAIEYFLRARELGMSDGELRTGLQVLIDEAIQHVMSARVAREAGDLVLWEAELVKAGEFQPGLREISHERSEACSDQAMAALVEQDLEAAVVHFQAALTHYSDSLLVRHYLATVHFEMGDFEAAVEQWYEVVDQARLDKASLPEPVHLRLAEALGRCGRMEEGRQVLQAYLDLEPTGEYIDLTRQLLRALPNPPARGDGVVPVDGEPEGTGTESAETDDPQPSDDKPADGEGPDGASGGH